VVKEWPVIEVNTALSLEVSGQKKVVPLLVGKPDLSRLPLIGGKDSMSWNGDAVAVAKRLKAAVDGNAPRRPAPPPKGPWGERIHAPSLPNTPPAPVSEYWSAPPTPSQPSTAQDKKRSWLGAFLGRSR
jgi:hypothetical protein